MKSLRFILVIIVLLTQESSSLAQQMKWKIAAPRILTPAIFIGGLPVEFGAIACKGKIILAGWSNLVLSTDGGLSWRNLSVPFLVNGDYVMDAAIYDDKTLAVMTAGHGGFLSQNQAASWQNFDPNGGGYSVAFDGSPTKLVTTHNSNTGYVSTNGVLKTFSIPIIYGSTVRTAADGSLRIFGADPSNAWLFSSYDHGVSWQRGTSLTQSDDYSFIMDQVDPKRCVIINENWVYRLSGTSNIFLSADKGVNWTNPYSQPLGPFADLVGDCATGCHDYFAGTKTNGILRSTDKGLSWKSIGGPPSAIDSRALGASDDSSIFVIDTIGNIWVTDPINGSGSSSQVTGDNYFRDLLITTCDPDVVSPLYFYNSGCTKSTISKVEILGKDSARYSLVGSLSAPFNYPDSIRIHFSPTKSGITDGHLKITYSDGSTKLVDLSVNVGQPPISLSPSALFLGDTIYACSSDSVVLTISSPCPIGFSSVSITGVDSASFILEGNKSLALPKDSTIRILCTPLRSGKLSAYLVLVFSDGRKITVPMNLTVLPSVLAISPSIIFARDTMLICDVDTAHINISYPCSIQFTTIAVRGTDSTSFELLSLSSGSLPNDSIIRVACHPEYVGKLSAEIYLRTTDGKSWILPLKRFIKSATLDIQPLSFFENDTIRKCGSDSAELTLKSDCKLQFSSFTIIGTDSSSFGMSGQSYGVPEHDSVVRIYCNPTRSGKLSAVMHIVSHDGKNWDIPITPYVDPASIAISPSDLFHDDTISFCQTKIVTATITSTCQLGITALHIGGADSASFISLTSVPLQLSQDSTVVVNCIPKRTGRLSAFLHIEFSLGMFRDIPITIDVLPAPIIGFQQTKNIYTDVIGDDITVPISLAHSSTSVNAEFSIHFDTLSLVYKGCTDQLGKNHGAAAGALDPRISYVSGVDTILFAHFDFYPIDTECTHIIFDSLTSASGVTQCFDMQSDSIVATICSPQECARPTIARTMRLGKLPMLHIIPNPSSGHFSIITDQDLGMTEITLSDGLGARRFSNLIEISDQSPPEINVVGLPSGLYFLKVTGILSTLPVMIEK
ncbi:MAG: T9SS type A sorting domain-containing protein [bacterium]